MLQKPGLRVGVGNSIGSLCGIKKFIHLHWRDAIVFSCLVSMYVTCIIGRGKNREKGAR